MTSADGRNRTLARLAVFVAAVTAIAVPVGYAGGYAYVRIDSSWYLDIAQGNTHATMQPFAARQLGPLIVRALSSVTHLSLLHSFLALGIISLLITAAVCGWLLVRQDAGLLQLLAVGGIYFWSATFGSFMLPDTFSAALLSLFLLLLWKRKYTWAIWMLLPMFVARESTVLVVVCLLAAGWNILSWIQRGLTIVSSLAGMFIVHLLTSGSLPNREQMNPLLYMAGKVPWNFASNVLAMGPWMSGFNGFCATPRWTLNLPSGFEIGGSNILGLCGWQPAWHARLVLLALCSFGLLPLLTMFLACYHRRLLWGQDLFRRFCVVYGVISFLMAPLLGRSMERLFLYSWPLFLLITPVVAASAFRGKRIPWKLLLALHIATAWLDLLLFDSREQSTLFRAWGLLAIVVETNLLAWILLRRADLRPAPSLERA